MKSQRLKNRLLVISLILNVILIVFASFYVIKNSKGFNQKYLMRFKKEQVIMFGDSHTNRGDWSALLDRRDVLKLGFGGFTTIQLNFIMKRLVVDRNASICFIQAGGNDISGSRLCSDQLIPNLTSMVIYLKSNNITPVLQSLFHRPNMEYNHTVDSINIGIKQLALEHNIDYLDVNIFLDENNNIGEHVLSDNIHLNHKGYEIWGNVVRDYLEEKGIN